MSDYSLPDMASFQNIYKKLIGTQNQGCGVGVDAGVAVGQSRPFCLQSESELKSIKLQSSGPESQGTNQQQTMILTEC